MNLKNYFLHDFICVSIDTQLQILLLSKINGNDEKIDIEQKVVAQNDGSTRFFVYYIPKSIGTAEACNQLISIYEDSIERTNKIFFSPGSSGDLNIGEHEVQYSRRIYFYTETDIEEKFLILLNKIAKEKKLHLTIRNSKYLKVRMELDKPLAFISHDSRDKELIAKPIASGLSQRLSSVWYDEYSLKIGDSLKDSIEKGIKEAKKCILILTPNFLSNPSWTKKEFDTIFTREMIFNH